MKQGIFKIIENTPLTESVYRMRLEGDTGAITASGQFVNLLLSGRFLRRHAASPARNWRGATPYRRRRSRHM